MILHVLSTYFALLCVMYCMCYLLCVGNLSVGSGLYRRFWMRSTTAYNILYLMFYIPCALCYILCALRSVLAMYYPLCMYSLLCSLSFLGLPMCYVHYVLCMLSTYVLYPMSCVIRSMYYALYTMCNMVCGILCTLCALCDVCATCYVLCTIYDVLSIML